MIEFIRKRSGLPDQKIVCLPMHASIDTPIPDHVDHIFYIHQEDYVKLEKNEDVRNIMHKYMTLLLDDYDAY
jgi:hypothetical protein